MIKTIYLDNAATTQVDEKVVKAMEKYYKKDYGNASSLHQKGQEAKRALEEARVLIAKSINAKPKEIIFTSGGTESNNFALKGTAFAGRKEGKNHVITTKIEHDCVLNSCKWLEKQGFEVTYLPVDKEGFVLAEDLKKTIRKETILFSAIHGNNEIGTIQNLAELGKICHDKGICFHTDACQSYMKTEIDVKKMSLDLVTLNAHKIHGPKGVGALYIKEGTKIDTWQHGGGQESKIRSGTENIPGIVGFAEAVKNISSGDIKKISRLRDKLIKGIEEKIPKARLNGPKGEKRLANNINFIFAGVEGEAIGGYLDAEGICSSTGSACSSKSLEPSHVLLAIDLKPEESHGSLRLSLGKFNTEDEIDYVLEILPKIIEKLRKISPFDKIINKLIK